MYAYQRLRRLTQFPEHFKQQMFNPNNNKYYRQIVSYRPDCA